MEDAARVTPRDARDERATREGRDRVTGVCAAALREASITRGRARGRMKCYHQAPFERFCGGTRARGTDDARCDRTRRTVRARER